MRKLVFIILFSTCLISSCAKVSNYYSEYKKYLGLDKNDNFLLSRSETTFKNEDFKIESQNFAEASKSKTKKEKLNIDVVIENKVKETPIDSEFSKSLALFNSDRGKVKGEEDIERAPASLASYYENPYLKAQALIRKGNFKAAGDYLNIYLKDNSIESEHTYSCYFWLAELNLVKKDYIGAIANYSEILDIKFERTNYELIYFKLYESYSNMGRKELAERYLAKIKVLNPESTYIKLLK